MRNGSLPKLSTPRKWMARAAWLPSAAANLVTCSIFSPLPSETPPKFCIGRVWSLIKAKVSFLASLDQTQPKEVLKSWQQLAPVISAVLACVIRPKICLSTAMMYNISTFLYISQSCTCSILSLILPEEKKKIAEIGLFRCISAFGFTFLLMLWLFVRNSACVAVCACACGSAVCTDRGFD